MPDDKFERGILTKADREYLQNPDEYSRQAAYNREQAIRERLQRAFTDFPLLARALDDSVLDDLLSTEWATEQLDDGATRHQSELKDEVVALPYAMAFLIRATLATDRGDPFPEADVEATLSSFVRNTERGIKIWLNNRHELTGDASVSIEVDDLQRADELADELDNQDERLTGRERIETVSRLSRAGYSTEEILELVGEPSGSDDDTDGSDGE